MRHDGRWGLSDLGRSTGALGSVTAACLEGPEYWDGERHRGGIVALPERVQHSVPTKGSALDPDADGSGSTDSSLWNPGPVQQVTRGGRSHLENRVKNKAYQGCLTQ
jgi:hypothetical protein